MLSGLYLFGTRFTDPGILHVFMPPTSWCPIPADTHANSDAAHPVTEKQAIACPPMCGGYCCPRHRQFPRVLAYGAVPSARGRTIFLEKVVASGA